MIYVGPEGSSVVSGDIYGHYRELDGVHGLMGVPISDEQKAPRGGRVSHFAQGDIFRTTAQVRTRFMGRSGSLS